MASALRPEDFSSTPRVVFVADLAGFHQSFRSRSDADMVAFLDRFYRLAEEAIGGSGGRVIKYMGDAILAVFPEEGASAAAGAAVSLETAVARLCAELGLPMRLGANIHAGPVILAELGGPDARLDVFGVVVNQTFLLGRGSGIRISERVYRKLPSGERTPWEKNRPPAVYVMGG